MHAAKRQWYINNILRLKPNIGVTFTTLSGQQLKELYGRVKHDAHTLAHPCSAPPANGTLTRERADGAGNHSDDPSSRGSATVKSVSVGS